MSRLAAIDLVFLLLENQNSPTHMSSCLIFEPPARQKTTFVPKLIKALRASEVGKPFNRKVKWLEGGGSPLGAGAAGHELPRTPCGDSRARNHGATR